MQCPDCKEEVPPNHFYCPHCRAELPTAAVLARPAAGAAAMRQTKTQSKKKPAKKKAAQSAGPAQHSRKLFEIGWQGMQLILALVVLLGAFVAYQRVNWQSAADRVNEVASPVRPAEAAGIEAKPTRAATRNQPKAAVNEKGKPMALQATATAGLLIVKSATAARIYVDGKFAGNTPHSFTVAAGEHQLMLQAEGYQHWSRTILMRGNQQVGMMAALEKLPGR